MKLSERMRAIWKQQEPEWTEEEAREMTYFPEWADEVATLEAKLEAMEWDRDTWRGQAQLCWDQYDEEGFQKMVEAFGISENTTGDV